MLREYASIINDQSDSGVIEKVVELERREKVHIYLTKLLFGKRPQRPR